MAVGQAPLGRSAVGIVCLWVRVGVVHRGCVYIYIYTPTVHTTHKRADRRSPGRDIYIERDSVSVCVRVCLYIVFIQYIYRHMHAHTKATHTGGQHAVVVHPVHRSPARTRTCVYYIYMYMGLPSYITLASAAAAAAPFSSLWD